MSLKFWKGKSEQCPRCSNYQWEIDLLERNNADIRKQRDSFINYFFILSAVFLALLVNEFIWR